MTEEVLDALSIRVARTRRVLGFRRQGPDADANAAPRETILETANLALGDLREATLIGGDVAVITLTAPQPALDWNLHGHVGGGTQTIHEELGIVTARYTFTPPSDAHWLLLLRNKHTDAMAVTVKIELFGAMEWAGFE